MKQWLALPGLTPPLVMCCVTALVLAAFVASADLLIRPTMFESRFSSIVLAGALGLAAAVVRLRVVGRAASALEKALAQRSVLNQLPTRFRPRALVQPSTGVDSWLAAKIRSLMVRLTTVLVFDITAALVVPTVVALRSPIAAGSAILVLAILTAAVTLPTVLVSTHRLGHVPAEERPSIRAAELLGRLLEVSPWARLGRIAWVAAALAILWLSIDGEGISWIFTATCFGLVFGLSAAEAWWRLRHVGAGFVSIELAGADLHPADPS